MRPSGISRTICRAVGKRLLLGLLLVLLAQVAGWILFPPEIGTDAATVYWYTH